jgi:23S rRNA (guanosine2251-2'-O)-methyltransferase
MTDKVYLHGKNALAEAVKAEETGNKGLIESIYLTPQAEADGKITSLLQKAGLKHERVTPEEIEHMVGHGNVHQGVCALLRTSQIYTSLEEALQEAKNGPTKALFVLLDELQDPHNVGAIIRSAAAFGATAILMPEHDQVQVTSTVVKTSAGMVFAVPIVRIGNVNTTLKKLKDSGFWIYGLTGDGNTKLRTAEFDADTVLVIGSEGDGIREKTLETCDFRLAIDIDPKCESLNASNAVAVALYEWNKQNIR